MPPNDAVTGALSMPAFGAAYAKAVGSGPIEDAALWYLDIRNFRAVNPNFGFFAGNAILSILADLIRECLAGDLPISRLGADRFIFLSAGKDFDAAHEAFIEIIDRLNEDVGKAGIGQRFNLMAGIYYLRDVDFESRSHQRPLDYASIAHRNARRNPQSSLVLFTSEDLERDTRRITIEQTIDQALEEGQIEVWYQPQIDYTYGEVIGAEALARWNHPELGWISPAEFIPVLENCGKVHDLDLYIWEEACRNAGRWHSVSDGNPVPISVNVSRAEMFEPGLLEHFVELRSRYGLPPGSLHLEVTESAFVEEADRLYEVIERLRENNLLVEMDDFGSGLSSLNMLKDVPVDVVKLDMGFMRSGINQERGGVVLGSVIRMLQGLDTPIIAEGVETLEQAEMLKNMGCHLMQGFHFSRPMPLREFEAFIGSTNASEANLHRNRHESHLDELLSIDAESSFLFNNVMGGTMFFFAGAGTSESILVNDEFYEACGLTRDMFGNAKVNPIQEIDPDSRAALWRSAAQAREDGGAFCRAQVRLTGRWFEGVMRFLGTSVRGDVYSLNIVRSGSLHEGTDHESPFGLYDEGWRLELLDKIVPNGFIKCRINDELTIDYISPQIISDSGLTQEEFVQRFRNSFAECVAPEQRHDVLQVVYESLRTGDIVQCEFDVVHGVNDRGHVEMLGNVGADAAGVRWLYALILSKGAPEAGGDGGQQPRDAVVTFDYYESENKLVVHDMRTDGESKDIVIEDWLDRLDKMPEGFSKASAAKVLATVRDLRHHPTSGFTDLKCNLRGGVELRWYHINYTCETDGEGNLTAVRGYAQDANDTMGSTKWWRRQAEIDHLTGLLNRNAVEQSINLAMRTQGQGMMVMADLDDFKRVNDQLGHLVGDELLRDVATALASEFRESDVLGRYGGDEFVAFVPISTGMDARRMAERRAASIIDKIATIDIVDGSHPACSVGVAICYDRAATFYDLLEAADKAMYESKLAGKGRYTVNEM